MPLPIKLESRPLSSSSLSAFSNSPAHYINYLFQSRTKSEPMLLGDTVDCLILTPDNFEKRFAVEPLIKGNSKAAKAERAAFLSANPDKTIIAKTMYDKAIRMRDSVLSNPACKELLDRLTQTQRKINFTDKETGLPLTGFIDGDGEGIIIDLKTTQYAHPDDFSKSVFNYNYHLQAAIYIQGMKALGKFCEFYWICVESSAPFGCSVIKPHADVIKLGNQQLRKLLDMFKYCMDNDLWKMSYDFWRVNGKYELPLPAWKRNELDK